MSEFVVLDPCAPVPDAGRQDDVPAARDVWVRGQLHAHTTFSVDGRMTPAEAAEAYGALGFDFVCFTDHDRVWPGCEWRGRVLVVPGEESTLFRPVPPLGRHLLRLFVTEPVSRLARAAAKMNAALRAGGLLAAAHPAWTGNLGTGRWDGRSLQDPRLRLVEIVNHHCRTADNLALWDAALTARGPGAPLWGTAVDDSHRVEQVGRAWVWVRLARPLREFGAPEAAAGHLKEALARGAFYASTGPQVRFVSRPAGRSPAIFVEVVRQPAARRPGERPGPGPEPEPPVVRFVGAQGRPLGEMRAWETSYPVGGDEGYVRVEVEVPGQGEAWSQPFWVVPGPAGPPPARGGRGAGPGEG